MKLIKASDEQQLIDYKNIFEEASGNPLSLDFLKRAQLFLFIKKNKIVAGFVICNEFPFRTLNVISDSAIRNRWEEFFNKKIFFEACSFWIDKKYRKNKVLNILIWLQISKTVKKQPQPFIIYGTNTKALGKMYAQPKNSLMIHHVEEGNKNEFLFCGKKSDFTSGVWEIIAQKLFGKIKKRNYDNDKIDLRKKVFNLIENN